MASKDYVLSSGQAARERLRILGRVTLPGTNALFGRIRVE